jgi:hypothetical protein
MSDEPRADDPRAIWREQPKEDTPVIVDHVMNRRTRQLHWSTRSEIVMSIAAAVFFVAVLTWRLPPGGFALQPIGLAAAALWIATTAFRFRRLIWGAGARPDSASSGVAYYRRELEIRRDHLRNAWLWHGPVLLSGLLFVGAFAGRAFPGMDRLRHAWPLFAILVLWIALGIWRRFRQAAELQREIDELAGLEDRP